METDLENYKSYNKGWGRKDQGTCSSYTKKVSAMGLCTANSAFFAFCFGGISVDVGTLKLLRSSGQGRGCRGCSDAALIFDKIWNSLWFFFGGGGVDAGYLSYIPFKLQNEISFRFPLES